MAPLEVFASLVSHMKSMFFPLKLFFKRVEKLRVTLLQKYTSRGFSWELMDIVTERTIPRLISINGYICRVWYKGQQIICNSCGAQGHEANECPDKDKCHRFGETGHLVRRCTNSWGTRLTDVQDPRSTGPSNSVYPGVGSDRNANHDPPAQGASVTEPDPGSFSSSADGLGVGDANQNLPSQGASASEAELDPGSCPSGDVNQDLPAQGASVPEPESDPGSSSVSTGISLGDDSPELVIEEFSSPSQSSFQSISSDFSSERKSILKPVEVDNVKESNVINDSNGNGNINNSAFINESIDVKK